jgi:heat shock transcription factor 1
MRSKEPGQVPTSFLQKTYEILENADLSAIIAWNEDGTLFLVKKVTELCDQVLPVYFKHSNYASFVRQLNIYDFHKVREGTWDNAFKHPMFLRGREDLLKEIKRKTSENHSNITPSCLLTKGDCDEMLLKLHGLQRKQHQMEVQIKGLEDRNEEIMEYNKTLFRELCYYKDREQRIEQLLMVFASYIQNLSSHRKDGNHDVQDVLIALGAPPHLPLLKNHSEPPEDEVTKRFKLGPMEELGLELFDEDIDFLLGSQS